MITNIKLKLNAANEFKAANSRRLKGDTIAWPKATAVKHGRCSKSQVTGIMNKLMKLGHITGLQESRHGTNSVGLRFTDVKFSESMDIVNPSAKSK